MSIISRFANRFIKSRVIGQACKSYLYSVNVDRMMTEMCKAGFQDPDEAFTEVDPMQYYELRFYSHIARKWKPTLQGYEKQQFEWSVQKFEQYESLSSLLDAFHRITWEYRSLYLEITKELTSHNLWNRSEYTNHTFEHSLQDAIHKYIDLLKQLEDYPLWKERAKEEIGCYLHLIYNSTAHTEASREIFAKFDKVYYFK